MTRVTRFNVEEYLPSQHDSLLARLRQDVNDEVVSIDLGATKRFLYVATDSERKEALGYLRGGQDACGAWHLDVFVHDSHRRRGVARALGSAFITAQSPKALVLDISDRTGAIQALLAGAGFVSADDSTWTVDS